MGDALNNIKQIDLLSHINGKTERAGRATRINPCPICGHNDCFTVFESNTFKCYSCGAQGSIIDFEIAMGKADSVGTAIETLSQQYNIARETKQGYKSAKQATLEQIYNLSAEWYHQQLLNSKICMDHMLNTRKRSRETLIKEKIGFAAGKYSNGLHQYLSGQKIPLEDQLASGMVCKNDQGKVYDFFNGDRIIYPSFVRSQVCYFSTKPINKGDKVYNLQYEYRLKNCLFYGNDALGQPSWILVEGQEDRNSLVDLGYTNVICILGGLGDDQIAALAERSEVKDGIDRKDVYLCFDNDQAGEKYSRKLIAALSGTANVSICELGEFKDIDQLITKTEKPEAAVREVLRKSVDPVSWLIDRLPEDEQNPSKIAAALQPIIEVITSEPDDMIKGMYTEILKERLNAKSEFAKAIIRKIKLKSEDNGEEADEDEKYGLSVSRYGTQYIKRTKDSKKVISNFVMNIVRYIEDEDVRYYEVTLHTAIGCSRPIILSNEQRTNSTKFDAALAAVGPYYFSGPLNDLKEVWQLEEDRAAIKSYTCRFNRFGWIKEHDVWLFQNCAYKNGKLYTPEADQEVIVIDGVGYQSKNVRVFGGDLPTIDIEGTPTWQYVHTIIDRVWQMWDADERGRTISFRGYLAMGLLASSVYLPEIVAKENKFPYILAYGPPGTGKSEAMQFIMNMWGFRNGGENWGEATAAGISMAMEQLSCIPYWIEEFANASGQNTSQDKKIDIIKNIYNRVSSGKGGLQGRTVRQVNASLFLTGQDRPENQAFLSRCVVLRKERPTEKGSQGYYLLKSEGKKLTHVVRWLIENKTKENIAAYWQAYDQLMSELPKAVKAKIGDYNPRTIVNYSIIAAGFSLYGFRPDHDNDFLKWLADECISDMRRKQAEDIVYRFFYDLGVIFKDNPYEVFAMKTGKILYMHYGAAYNSWRVNGNKTSMPETLSRGGLLDYMRHAPEGYYIEPNESGASDRVYIGRGSHRKQQRAVGIRVDRLPENIRKEIEGWGLDEEID